MGNETLRNAGKAKNDEFYTQISDIEKECRHYKGHFKDKTILCNCDDPYESEFFKYFALNFNHLGLKKLLASCYIGSPIANTQLSLFDYEDAENKTTKSPHKIEITEMIDENAGDMRGLPLVEYILRNKKNALTRLLGDGDFRSTECIEMLKEADIVVTNPPFSLFREYVAQLMEYEKKFLIIGNQNNISYKEIFQLIKENKIWLGTDNGGTKWFQVPAHYDIKTETRIKVENGVKYFSMGNIAWFTNLDHKKRHEKLILFRQYNPAEYPNYDEYNAINVSKYIDIPVDYTDVMGVPVTFLDKYNPDQFEIIGIDRYVEDNPHYGHRFKINGKEIYAHVLIKRKQ
jgi:hypothetical protein